MWDQCRLRILHAPHRAMWSTNLIKKAHLINSWKCLKESLRGTYRRQKLTAKFTSTQELLGATFNGNNHLTCSSRSTGTLWILGIRIWSSLSTAQSYRFGHWSISGQKTRGPPGFWFCQRDKSKKWKKKNINLLYYAIARISCNIQCRIRQWMFNWGSVEIALLFLWSQAVPSFIFLWRQLIQ